MNPSLLEILGTLLFSCAVIHTFLANQFEKWGGAYPVGSIGENIFHFLGEVEVIFGLWAGIFIVFYALVHGFAIEDESHHVVGGVIHFLESINYTEPVFVFVIMAMSATRPLIAFAESLIKKGAQLLPLPEKMAFYVATLILGPILGSFITEPAAMTVTSLILLNSFFSHSMSPQFKYATLGLLFVNISIVEH